MPKRNNPFGDHSSLQLKTHIREKEVNNGVCQQTLMQSVFERTHQLLFTGIRQKQDVQSEMIDANDNDMTWSDENTKVSGSSLKQLHIDKNCQLVSMEDMDIDSSSSLDPCPQTCLTVSSCASSSTANACSGFAPVGFGHASSRNPSEYSPLDGLVSPRDLPTASKESLYETGTFSQPVNTNAFLQMMQAQSKNTSFNKCLLSGGACHNCRKPVPSQNIMKCQFCENYFCCSCMRQCGGCHLHYCQLCSVINYDQSTERAFCLSCRGR